MHRDEADLAGVEAAKDGAFQDAEDARFSVTEPLGLMTSERQRRACDSVFQARQTGEVARRNGAFVFSSSTQISSIRATVSGASELIVVGMA